MPAIHRFPSGLKVVALGGGTGLPVVLRALKGEIAACAGTLTGIVTVTDDGGSSGRLEATGRGILYVAQEATRYLDMPLEGATVAVQGFGNVGSVAARLLRQAGARIVAASDSRGAVYDGRGLDVDAVAEHKRAGGYLPDFKAGDHIASEEIVALPVDILVPAALEGQVHGRNAGRVAARLIVEGANGPLTPEADRILAEKNVFVVPDILANAGGVIVSYFEWVQDLQSFFWEEDEVNQRLHRLMTRSFRDVVALAEKEAVSMREAAYMLGVSRVVEAVQARGIYP